MSYTKKKKEGKSGAPPGIFSQINHEKSTNYENGCVAAAKLHHKLHPEGWKTRGSAAKNCAFTCGEGYPMTVTAHGDRWGNGHGDKFIFTADSIMGI
jgi:hypothetical protein